MTSATTLDAAVTAFVSSLMEDYTADDINRSFACIGYVRSAPVPQGAEAPAGFKLVPLEPTREMLDALCDVKNRSSTGIRWVARDSELRAAWGAMLAAAPLAKPEPSSTTRAPLSATLTCAGIAMAARCKALPLMTAIRDAGEGEVTLNQHLTTDQALQAIAAIPMATGEDAQAVEPAAALTHEQIAAAGLGLEYVHSVLRWAACGYVHTPERIANLHTAYRIVDKLVDAQEGGEVAPQGAREWAASRLPDGRVVIDSANFEHDCRLELSGDFEREEEKLWYAGALADKLNVARSPVIEAGAETILDELIACKDLKESMTGRAPWRQREIQAEYDRRKPLAWAAARALRATKATPKTEQGEQHG